MSKKFFVILDGPIGAGKTTVTNLLSKKLKRTAILSYDLQKWSITDFGLEGEKDSAMIATARRSLAAQYMKYGLNILLDGGFFRGSRIKPFVSLAKRKKYRILIYQLTAPQNVLYQRTKKRPKNHPNEKNHSKQDLEKYWSFHEEHHYRGDEVTTLNSGTIKPGQIVNRILKDLGGVQ